LDQMKALVILHLLHIAHISLEVISYEC
jgi:hypothetical protein